jgi:hypothetical protein
MGPVHPKVFSRFLKDLGLERGMIRAPSVKLNVKINRKVRIRLYPFTDYFKGFEQTQAVRSLFGGRTKQLLDNLKVEFSGSPIRMIAPDEEDGHLQVSAPYLETGEERLLYVDVLVCLNLLKRMSEGGRLVDPENPDFSSSQVLIDSYRAAAEEAKRLGVSDSELVEHMFMPRFLMTSTEFRSFLGKVGIDVGKRK